MSIQLSKALIDKSVVLNSMTIDSPTDRKSKRTGDPLRPTVYFDNPVTDKDTGKLVAGKKSTLFTPNAEEAEAL